MFMSHRFGHFLFCLPALLLILAHPALRAADPVTSNTSPARTQGAGVTTPLASPAPSSDPVPSEVLQTLLQRLEQLEQRDAALRERDNLLQQQQDAALRERDQLIQQLQGRIADLERKLTAVEDAQVLPEIAAEPEPGPTAAEVDQKIRVLERQIELDAETAQALAQQQPRLEVGSSGFALHSANDDYVLRLRGLIQADTRNFFNDHPLNNGNDGFLLRRARPILEGTVLGNVDFRFVPEFGGPQQGIQDAWLNYRFSPALQLQAGRFKGPVGYEALQGDSVGSFNERSLVSNLLPNRQQGVQLHGDLADRRFGYSLGIFNRTGDGRLPSNSGFGDDPEFAGRLSLQPFLHQENSLGQGLSLGVGGAWSQVSSNLAVMPNNLSGTQPGYLTPAFQQFFAYNAPVGPVVADGDHWRVSPYLSWYHGPFGFLGEYIISQNGVLNATTQRRADLQHQAWQVSAQWVLTGEPASYNGIIPARPFQLGGGGWGAWQLVARFGQFDIDNDAFLGFSDPNTSASLATSWSVGINWWLNRNLRFLSSFTHTTFDGGGRINPVDPLSIVPPATVTHQDENAFMTRMQLSF